MRSRARSDESPAPTSGPSSAVELARTYGLTPSAARPGLFEYLGRVWERRHFISQFAASRMRTQFAGARLGQVWQLLTPLLNAGVYYLMFGVILQTSRSIPNFTAFLVTGVFVMTFTQRSITSGSRSIGGNLSLIRALHFPRACLPLAFTLVELQQLAISLGVLVVIVLLTGEPVTAAWILVLPAVALQTCFNMGLSLVIARIGAFVQDINQLLPFILRVWLYLSGVFFSIPDRMGDTVLAKIMSANPAAVYIELVRDALINGSVHPEGVHPPWSTEHLWMLAIGWAVIALVAGFWFFWAAEEKYGRG